MLLPIPGGKQVVAALQQGQAYVEHVQIGIGTGNPSLHHLHVARELPLLDLGNATVVRYCLRTEVLDNGRHDAVEIRRSNALLNYQVTHLGQLGADDATGNLLGNAILGHAGCGAYDAHACCPVVGD